MKNILFFVATLMAQISLADFCSNYEIPQKFSEIKNKTETEITVFSNKKSIAAQADEILGKLLAAKSPVIQDWMSKRDLKGKSETEIVSEWRKYYAKFFLLTKYPHDNKQINSEIEKLMANINKLFSTADFRKKMEKIFSDTQKFSLKKIESFPINSELKKQISSRVKNIKLYWMKDFKKSKFKELPLDFLDWGIAYDPVNNEINMGLNALAYSNEETYMSVFAHEIGHSFDSCRWGAFYEGKWPFAKIEECLRQENTVNAKKRDDTKLDELVKNGKISTELSMSLKANPTCNKMAYPPVGVQADQLPESFADWFSAEVVSDIPNLKYQNLRLELCENKELTSGSSYPSNRLRLENIYFAHPKIRTSRVELKDKKTAYCGWN